VGNQPALLGKISVRFKPATQGQMHDLRQRHCRVITPTLLCRRFADVRDSSLGALSIGVAKLAEEMKSRMKSNYWIVI